ncbi:MAG TPA: glycosyltransferase family 39 protein [Myxococcota bacterium]|nr:glycosyltransferase family 39 protein [Myxococcota bacterium]
MLSFANLAVLVTVRTLLRNSTTRQDDFVLGLLLGLALLTKYTSALLVPTVVGLVAAKRWVVERWPPSRIAAWAMRALTVSVRKSRREWTTVRRAF